MRRPTYDRPWFLPATAILAARAVLSARRATDVASVTVVPAALTRADRTLLALAIGGTLGISAAKFAGISDFTHLWAAARVMLASGDPYAAVGVGRQIPWPYPLFYPVTALWLLVPFAWMPLAVAQGVFVALTGGALAYLFGQQHPWRLLAFVSAGSAWAASMGQFTFALTVAALLPMACGVVFAAKPNIGAAMWAFGKDWRALIAPAALTLLTLMVDPHWLARWFAVTRTGNHPVPLLQPLGFLTLLALLRWRRPEARLLLTLAAVPQNMAQHDVLLFFLVARTRSECVYLVLASWLAVIAEAVLSTGPSGPSRTSGGDAFIAGVMAVNGPMYVLLFYVPCVLMILRRPNAG